MTLTHTIQPLENAEVFNILQATFIRDTGQAVGQATGFKLEKHRHKTSQKLSAIEKNVRMQTTGKFCIKTLSTFVPLNTSHFQQLQTQPTASASTDRNGQTGSVSRFLHAKQT